MSRFILYTILFYLLYKFVADFLIPVGRASAQVRRNMQQMQEEQQRFRQQQQAQQPSRPPQSTQPPREEKKDYIDFEEVS